MSPRSSGIVDHPISESAFAVLDLETTGLNAGTDRVVEIALVRKEPNTPPQLVLNTLVNPQRRVAATEIHGITDDDVLGAPVFEEIAGELVRSLSGCIVASYNVYFDMPFLEYELRRAGISESPPHLCLMYLRPMLGLGPRCALAEACRCHGIRHTSAHLAAADVSAAAQLMDIYLKAISDKRLSTFRDLMRLKNYKFLSSFSRYPLSGSALRPAAGSARFKARSTQAPPPRVVEGIPLEEKPAEPRLALSAYWDALTAAIADLEITDVELLSLEEKRRELDLREEQVRVLHARAFEGAITRFVDDQWLDDGEREKLQRLYRCLSRLGWAPGE